MRYTFSRAILPQERELADEDVEIQVRGEFAKEIGRKIEKHLVLTKTEGEDLLPPMFKTTLHIFTEAEFQAWNEEIRIQVLIETGVTRKIEKEQEG